MAELRSLVFASAQELGFDYVALLHHASLCRTDERHFIRLDNYPLDWAAELIGSKIAHHDPVHVAAQSASAAFRWADLHRIVSLDQDQHRILERSRDFGIGDGLTVPVNVPGEPSGSCSFAVRSGVRLPEQQFLAAELVGLHGFEAARRISRTCRSRPHLSRREVQCLRLIAAGKTDYEISVILGISLETTRQYVKRARSAYEVLTRAQLVALGLRDQWLNFEDAVHPRA